MTVDMKRIMKEHQKRKKPVLLLLMIAYLLMSVRLPSRSDWLTNALLPFGSLLSKSSAFRPNRERSKREKQGYMSSVTL
jgi:hypothetical protein